MIDVSNDDIEELFERLTIITDKGQEPYRIDKFLMNRIEGATRNKIQQAIEGERVLVNEKPVKSNYKIRGLDKIVVYQSNIPDSTEIIPENIPINIVYEDGDIMVINKPAGMVVHPGSGNKSGTLVNAVAWYLKEKDPTIDETKLSRFGLVHRIDKNTTGLLVMAKGQKAMNHLSKQFFEHTVHRRYVALVWGDFGRDEGTIRAHVGRHMRFRKLFTAYPEGEHGKDAVTHYRVLERFNYVSLIECKLETGRTHQIRVHLQSIGHPLFNDDFYGGDRIVKGTIFTKYKQFVENCFSICQRHALHAQQLGFIHPVTGEFMNFESTIPDDMEGIIDKWRNYSHNKNLTT